MPDIEEQMLKTIPSNGAPIGNKTLLTELKKKFAKLTDEEYWNVRNNLIEKGQISKGGGKGGSVYRQNIIISESKKEKKGRLKESDLYDPFINVIKKSWVKIEGIELPFVHKTAHQGRKSTGGKWTRPDVTLISIQNFQYIYGKLLEIITFEIKPEDGYGVESVFETASQSVFSHKSFLCIHLPSGKPDTEDFQRIVRQCELFGVGLIVFENVEDWNTYETIVDPKRKEPDPSEVNLFIKQQLTDSAKEEISKHLK